MHPISESLIASQSSDFLIAGYVFSLMFIFVGALLYLWRYSRVRSLLATIPE